MIPKFTEFFFVELNNLDIFKIPIGNVHFTVYRCIYVKEKIHTILHIGTLVQSYISSHGKSFIFYLYIFCYWYIGCIEFVFYVYLSREYVNKKIVYIKKKNCTFE